jgi:LmbE family N-acetylglucosaminyl deacetylase
VLDEALRRFLDRTGTPVLVWTFEGPWHQHPVDRVNTLVSYAPAAEAHKLAAVRAHRSQLARVPFDEGAAALARLRAVVFSESHLGGRVPGAIQTLPLIECYIRERERPPGAS